MPLDVADVVLHHVLARGLLRNAAAGEIDAVADRAGHGAVCRDVTQADLDQPLERRLKKRCAFERREKHLRINALAVAVVDHRVLKRILRGERRVPREQAGPDLAADERAAAVLEIVLVDARIRRLKPHAQVGLCRAVLGVSEDHQLVEVAAEHLCVEVQPVVLKREEPEHLNVEVVVRQRLAADVVRVIGNVVRRAVPLHRHAERAADVLADPAALHAAPVFLGGHLHGFVSFPQCGHAGISARPPAAGPAQGRGIFLSGRHAPLFPTAQGFAPPAGQNQESV